MTTAPVFADIETVLMDWLKVAVPVLADEAGEIDTHVGNEMPGPSLDRRLPFAWVRRVGGADTFFTDYPVVDIDTFGPTRRTARDVAEAIRVALTAPLVIAGGVVIDTATTRTAPLRLPWENPSVRRFGATYELSARRR